MRTASDALQIIRAAGKDVTHVDLEGCDRAVTDADVPSFFLAAPSTSGTITGASFAKCSRLTDKAIEALTTTTASRGTPVSEMVERLNIAGCSPGVTREGLLKLAGGRSGGFPSLLELDVSGCGGVKGAVAVPPRTTLRSLRALNLHALTAFTAQLPASSPLESIALTECKSLTDLRVSVAGLKTLNAAGCKRLTRLELHCATLESLVLQHCVDLASPIACNTPNLSTELNVNGCASLRTDAAAAMINASRRLRRVRASGLLAARGAMTIAGRCLREVCVDGCGNLAELKVRAPLMKLSARGCKTLSAVWIEDPPAAAEGEEEEEEGSTIAAEAAAAASEAKSGRLTVELRNCGALTRIVGVRAAALEERLSLDVVGCGSLPASARRGG
jgi:hypothetical protein